MRISDDKLPVFAATPFRPSVEWNLGTPDTSAPVSAYSVARGVPYTLPFRVRYINGAWRNALTGDNLAIEITGWK